MEFGALAEEFVALNKTKKNKQNYLVVSSNAHRYSDRGEKRDRRKESMANERKTIEDCKQDNRYEI